MTTPSGTATGYSSYWEESPVMASNGSSYLDLTHAESPLPALSNFRICYADQGIAAPASGRLDVWDCQFYQCNAGVAAGTNSTVAFHNALFSECGAAVGASPSFAGLEAEHITADVTNLCAAQSPPARVCLTNSIIIGAFSGGAFTVTQNVVINPSGPIFQAVGAGRYYLGPNGACRGAGTPAISLRLQAELQRKTTQPPIAFPPHLVVSGDISLLRRQHATPAAPPTWATITKRWITRWPFWCARAKITVNPGTAVGFRQEYAAPFQGGTGYGFDLRENSTFVSAGTPAKPNRFVDVQFVQEQPESPCVAGFVPDFQGGDSTTPPPSMDFRFSHFYATPNNYHFWSGLSEDGWYSIASPSSSMNWSLRDCALHGGRINLGQPDNPAWTGYSIPSDLDNPYYLGAPVDFVYAPGAVSWVNNLFDCVNVNIDPTYLRVRLVH